MFGWVKRQFTNLITNLSDPADWFIRFIRGGGGDTDSGVEVNQKTAIGYAPVWYAVSKIAGHVSTLPITPMKRLDPTGAEKAKSHPSFKLVRRRPNPYMSAAQFWETLMVHALLHGNGKAAIVRSPSGAPQELLTIDPKKSMTVYVDGEKWHAFKTDDDDRLENISLRDSFEEQDWTVIPDRDCLHIPGLGVDGVIGLEIIDVSKNTFGTGLAGEKATGKDFANGSKPGVILEAPQNTFKNDTDADHFVDQFDKFHRGVDNRGRTALIRDGMKVHSTGTDGSATQSWVEQRTFQRQEVALLFLLEAILGDDNSVSYNSIEQKQLNYLVNCLMRWLVKIEQECDEKLLSERQKRADSHFFKFNTAALLRADYRTTIEALALAIQARIMNPNEAREKLDMNPYEGGDEYVNPNVMSEDGGESQADSEGKPDPEDANRAAIVAHLKHMLDIERKRVLNSAGNKKNYIAWLEKFYAGWEVQLRHTIEQLGGDAHLAQRHCDGSFNSLVEIAGTVSPDGLADAVSEHVNDWPTDKSEALALEILGVTHV